jgi:multiple sugar transport system permease protein
MNKKPGDLVISIISYLFIGTSLLFFLFPVFWMFLTSIKPPQDVFAIPPKWIFKPTWVNYTTAFVKKDYLKYLWNSFFITSISVIVATVIAAMAAYVTARFRFKGKNTMLLGLLVFYTMPGIAYAIPLFLWFSALKIIDTPLALIIVFTALTIPFATWVLNGYFVSIPRDLEEAAMIDGCSQWGALFRVVLPLAAPGVAATAILTFIGTWNSFLYPAILAGSKTITLPTAIATFITNTSIEWGQAAAVASVIILPVVILVLLGQRYIIMGLVSGAVKE